MNQRRIEDGCWLRKSSDASHINVAELDGAIKGLNMAIKWNFREIELRTDSSVVCGWLSSTVNKTHRVKTHGMSEMLIRRRLELVRDLIETYEMKVQIKLVKTTENMADEMTRLPKNYHSLQVVHSHGLLALCKDDRKVISDVHKNTCHMGVERTRELVLNILPYVTYQQVDSVVRECEMCQRIDPPSRVRLERGTLQTESVWQRLALDITYYCNAAYLTIIDCCSRYTIWKRLKSECVSSIKHALESVFVEFGPPHAILSDNAPVFMSHEFECFLKEWNVGGDRCCAYRHQGNGICERIHRTIKRMAERSDRNIGKAVFWYNVTTSQATGEIPFAGVFRAKPALPGLVSTRKEVSTKLCSEWSDVGEGTSIESSVSPGDFVYLKPRDGRCTSTWTGPHRVESSTERRVELSDGVSRHISHVRPVNSSRCPTDAGASSTNESEDTEMVEPTRDLDQHDKTEPSTISLRDRSTLKPPQRYCCCCCLGEV